jgi:hypothetical protein
MELDRVSGWLQNYVTAKLTCRGCERVTAIGLDKLLEMSAANDCFTWWRERFKCQRCGAKSPYLAVVPTHLTPVRYSPHPWAARDRDRVGGGQD